MRLSFEKKQEEKHHQREGAKPGKSFKTQKKTARRSRSLQRKSLVKKAEGRLKNFRQASLLAVAFTGFFLLMLADGETTLATNSSLAENTQQTNQPVTIDNEKATDEAIDALQNLWDGFLYNYPKFLIALGCLFLAWLVARMVKFIFNKTTSRSSNASGIKTIVVIVIWLLAIGVALSILAGDIRALLGSFGLIGLALSWALQTPIESFTGWLLNSFRRYYKIGDRIRVGEVFGDVYKIDFLSTTVWEIGSPYQPGFVNAEQPTGRMVTFPNNEILSGTVINLTGDFPYVWDELVIVIANESDTAFALKIVEEKASEEIGEYMTNPAKEYSRILRKAGLEEDVPSQPQLYLAASDSWTEITVRYLVGVKERRKWKTILLQKINQELSKEEYQSSILPAYPRQQVQFINSKGKVDDQKESED